MSSNFKMKYIYRYNLDIPGFVLRAGFGFLLLVPGSCIHAVIKKYNLRLNITI